MVKFADSATSLAERMGDHPTGEPLTEGEVCRRTYLVISDMVNDLALFMGEHPPDLVTLRTEAERALRRYEIRRPESEAVFEGALKWMLYNGRGTDFEIVKEARSVAAEIYPETIDLLDATLQSISTRTKISAGSGRGLSTPTVSLLYAALMAYVVILSVVIIGPAHILNLRNIALAIGLAGGAGSALVLLRAGITRSRALAARIALIAAGFLMLAEAFELIRVAQRVR